MGAKASTRVGRLPAIFLQAATSMPLVTPAGNNPCFSYTTVVNCLLPCINHLENDVVSPYWFFSGGVNFFITSSYLLANSGNNYATDQASATYGPAISEAPSNELTAMDAAKYTTYAFKETPTGRISIQVCNYVGPTGVLTFDKSGLASIVDEDAANLNSVSFGVVGIQDPLLNVTSVMLLYSDISMETPRAMALIPAGMTGPVPYTVTSDGSAPGSAHGIYTSNPAFMSTLTFDPKTLYLQPVPAAPAPAAVRGPSAGRPSIKSQLVLFRWTLMLAEAPSKMLNASAAAYMSTHCMGTTTDSCRGGTATPCTFFLSDGAVGQTCNAASKIDVATTDAAYKAMCSTAHKDALALPDCSCINYAQSTYRQKDLNGGQTYPEFQAWLKKNGLPAADSKNVSCWWPACTSSRQAGTLTLSATGPAAPCPDITECISAITVSDIDTGVVTKTVSNACGGTGGGTGGTGDNTLTSPSTPFLKSGLFVSLIIFSAVAVVCIAVAYVLATTSGSTAPPRTVYIRPEDVPRIRHYNGG